MSSRYEYLRPFADTDAQVAKLDAIAKAGTVAAAAERLGINERTLFESLAALRTKAARKGVSPNAGWNFGVADGFGLGKVTTQRNAKGEIERTWDRQSPDLAEQKRALEAMIAELVRDTPPRKPRKAPKSRKYHRDLMVGYPIGDHHFGMYAHAAESGEDWDISKSKAALGAAIDYLVDMSPPSETALIANLGDFAHVDDSTMRTRKSGHLLDVAGRHHEIIEAAAFTLAHTIERALEKHKRVKICNVKGNHDEDSASWLSIFLKGYFRNEPRVEVDMSPAMFLFHRFGANMLCMTHGHRVKLPDLPGVMASMKPAMWGETKYRCAWTGHVHHNQTQLAKENRGAYAESFGVLPPTDAHGAGVGFQGASQREMQAITFKRAGGILSRAYYNADLSGKI